MRELPESHDCVYEKCTPPKHYGVSIIGTCLVCGGCFDPEHCTHEDYCYPPEDED